MLASLTTQVEYEDFFFYAYATSVYQTTLFYAIVVNTLMLATHKHIYIKIMQILM